MHIKIIFIILIFSILSGCNGKLPGADARKFSKDPEERVKKNLAEGRGITFNEIFGNSDGGGKFEFASSNPLWRASLDVIDFMPLISVNYSGGIIITDWYSDQNNPTESIKINIRFLTNEIRSDALDIKIFLKQCADNGINCTINRNNDELVAKLKSNILKKAARYEKEAIDKNKKENPYRGSESVGGDAPEEDKSN